MAVGPNRESALLSLQDAMELTEFARMALSDLGYDPRYVRLVENEHMVSIIHIENTVKVIPLAVVWMVWELAHIQFGNKSTSPMCCWSCFSSNETSRACSEGNCANPDKPRRPPRSLLVTADEFRSGQPTVVWPNEIDWPNE